MFSIGEFSIITRLSVKTLRYYHEEEILLPDYIDEDSGYRYYRESSIGRAFVIALLRDMEFSVADIREMIQNYSSDEEILVFLQEQKKSLEGIIRKYRGKHATVTTIIDSIKRNKLEESTMDSDVKVIILDDILFAGIRFKGKYSDVGEKFSLVARQAGRLISGKAMSLYYDNEYKEDNADIEAGFPVSRTIKKKEVISRILPGGKAVTLIHNGPYDTLGNSYKAIFSYIEEHGYLPKTPSREVYIKGPGIIFAGNPKKYITEIQIAIED